MAEEKEPEGMMDIKLADHIVDMVQKHRSNYSKLKLLDAGGGTGVTIKQLAEAGLGELYMFDVTTSNIVKAKEKLKEYIGRGQVKDVKEASLPNIPYEDQFFDVVMFNQVLHHLDIWEEQYGEGELCTNKDKAADPLDINKEWPKCKLALQEAHRVLKPGGLLLFSEMLADQYMAGPWHYALSPKVQRDWSLCFPPLGLYRCYLLPMGFKEDEIVDSYAGWDVIDPHTGKLEGNNGLNPLMFMASEEDVAEMKQNLERMRADGSIDQFVKDNHHETEGATLLLFTKVQ